MTDRYIPEHRRNFKAKGTFKPDELRRRREEQQVEIRKQKREENLAKRRNMVATSPAPGADSDDEGATESQVCDRPPPRLTVFFPVGLSSKVHVARYITLIGYGSLDRNDDSHWHIFV
jgi:hypothetical protein